MQMNGPMCISGEVQRPLYLSPLAGRGRNERVFRAHSGEGAAPQAQTRGEAPSPRPSPRKRGEGEESAADESLKIHG